MRDAALTGAGRVPGGARIQAARVGLAVGVGDAGVLFGLAVLAGDPPVATAAALVGLDRGADSAAGVLAARHERRELLGAPGLGVIAGGRAVGARTAAAH